MIVEIVDIGSGNIRSIQNWIERLHIPTKIITKANDIKSDFLILPGIGSAGIYMETLRKTSFDKAILEHVDKNHRLLGICLGFQVMANTLEEDGGCEGMGLINGSVERVENNVTHNGWENFNINKEQLNKQSFHSKLELTRKKILNDRVFYNHEYGFVNNDNSCFDLKISSNFKKYSAMIVKDNIIGFQFHPEKSQQAGIDLISMIL